MTSRWRVPPRASFEIADQTIPAGARRKLEIPIANLMSGTPVSLPVIVHHGKSPGPSLWLTAAIHGDELCGVEIIRRVLNELDPKRMKGTVVAVPVVNVHGFNTGDRYLPDRRDLNRSFPGSPRGSLASRIAHLLFTEVIERCDVGIDLHTGSGQRENLPQIRANLEDPATMHLASVFGAPIAIHSKVRDGSLRQAATDTGSTVLLYEAGEANRFSRMAFKAGTVGVLRVIHDLGIQDVEVPPAGEVALSYGSTWMRATRSGVLHLNVELGQEVAEREVIATMFDPFGKLLGAIRTRRAGIVIGITHSPLVNRGDAIVHVATVEPSPPDTE